MEGEKNVNTHTLKGVYLFHLEFPVLNAGLLFLKFKQSAF